MRPNFVLITCHDLGKHLGCYGRNTVTSPALDSLAADGVLLENAFCTAPQCSPSRSALLTGRYAHANGVMGLTHAPFNWGLHPGEKHLARLLGEAGYDTALVGEQHLAHNPLALGYTAVTGGGAAPMTAAHARAYLERARGSDRPFFLEVGFVEAHRPYDWGGATPETSRGVGVPPYLPDTPQAREEVAALQGAIRRLDEAVGMICQALQETGLDENTWLIFTADHGLAMPRAKGTLYDPGVEVAMLMRWPAGGLVGGRRLAELTSHIDLVPTLLEGAGVDVPSNLHGRSYWPLLRGDAYQPNRAVFAEKTYHTAYEPMRMVRTATHKLIVNFEVGPRFDVPDDIRHSPLYPQMLGRITGQRPQLELYDLAHDPLELENMAARSKLANVRQELLATLFEWMQATGDALLHGPIPSPFYRASRQLLPGTDT